MDKKTMDNKIMDNKINKAKKIFVRLGAVDCIITKKQWDNNFHPKDIEFYLIGFEDGDAEECSEDGTYLNQNIKGFNANRYEYKRDKQNK